ncbi:MAG: hypothetical protein WCO19_04215 [Candidatus Saccharibacteria bacterium]
MDKRSLLRIVVLFITLQLIGFTAYGALNQSKSNVNTQSEILAAIKDSPEFAKSLYTALEDKGLTTTSSSSQTSGQKGQKGETGTTGETGSVGAQGQKGNSGAPGQSGTNSTTSQSALLPSQTGKAGKILGTDGTDASWTSLPDGAPLKQIIAPRTITTTITADQVKSGPMIKIAPSAGTNEDRPRVVLPNPIDDPSLQGYVVQLFAAPKNGEGSERFGASLGYPSETNAYLDDLYQLMPSTLDFSSTPLTIEYEVNGETKQVTLDQDYSTHPETILTDIFAAALADGTIEIKTDYDAPGNNPTIGGAIVTKASGPQASISIVDTGDGDPLGLIELTAQPGITAYAGYDGKELGVGELNEGNFIGGGYTHTWPDEPYGIEQQSLTLIATEDGWRALKTPYRSEFLAFSPVLNWFLTSEDRNVNHALNTFDEEIFNIRARLDALENP